MLEPPHFQEKFMKEIWKDVQGYEDLYQVSNLGRVKSLPKVVDIKRCKITLKEKMLSQIEKGDYLSVILCNNRNRRQFSIHRLVAIAFIDNPNSLPEVNHKDEDKHNNVVSNLEWCDRCYNQNYGTCRERAASKLWKKVFQYSKNGEFIKEYKSIQYAADSLGIFPTNIIECCKGRRKSAGGYIWKYE